MITFKITKYTKDGDIMVVRTEERQIKSPGLPPTNSQCILMNDSEINDLVKALQDYANKR